MRRIRVLLGTRSRVHFGSGILAGAVMLILALTAQAPITEAAQVAAFPGAGQTASVSDAPLAGPFHVAKRCGPVSSSGHATCLFIVHFTVPVPGGAVLSVFSGGPATFLAAPTVFAFGCPPPSPTIVLTSPTSFTATIGVLGCSSGATLVFIEQLSVTGTGQICQKLQALGTTAGACAPVVFRGPVLAATKSCTPIPGSILANCIYTVTLVSGLPSGTTLNVGMTGAAAYTGVTATTTCTGGVTMGTVNPTNFSATVGVGGCSAGSTITFTEAVNDFGSLSTTVTQTVHTSAGGSASASAIV